MRIVIWRDILGLSIIDRAVIGVNGRIVRDIRQENWRRKRTSFWKKSCTSSIPYLSCDKRSTPSPKA